MFQRMQMSGERLSYHGLYTQHRGIPIGSKADGTGRAVSEYGSIQVEYA